MSFNTSQLNSNVFNFGEADAITGVGTLVYIEQEVANIGAGTLISIEQEVIFFATAEGTICDFEQEVVCTASGTICTIQQNVIEATTYSNSVPSFLERNGWDVAITIGGVFFPRAQLTGRVYINKTEDDNHTAEFTILLPAGTYNLYQYQGKPVAISIYTNELGWYTAFTGTVDIPVFDALRERLKLNCVADRRALIESITSPINRFNLGFYSAVILGEYNNTYEYITNALETVASSLDFDGYGQANLTSWTPKATADFTYGSSDVYRRNPQVVLESGAKVINQVKLTLEYGYQRLYHRQQNWQWTLGYDAICPFLRDRPSFPTKEMIISAIKGAGWPIRNNIAFTPIFDSGAYQCNGTWAMWSTSETQWTNSPVTDSSGNAVTDSSGNLTYQAQPTSITNNQDLYCMGASWNATFRWNQNITERYTVIVDCPNSRAIYGTLQQAESYGMTDPNQYAEWESSYKAYQPPPTVSGTISIYPDSNSSNYYIDATAERSKFSTAFLIALQKAKTTILKSHRDSRIVFQRELTPNLELKHTVRLTGKYIQGKGKASKIEHFLCISDCESGTAGEAYTAAELSFYRGVGGGVNSALNLVAPGTFRPTITTTSINLDTHLGIDPEKASNHSENWDGYIGNITTTVNLGGAPPRLNTYRTGFQEAFIVETPAIEDEVRDDRVVEATGTYYVDVPADSVSVTTYGVGGT
jgi:hypothetical protein